MSATDRRWLSLLGRPKNLVIFAGIAALSGVTGAVAASQVPVNDTRVSALINARLPNTKLTNVNCDRVEGLCEVTAGNNLFYVDHSGRYLVIGRVYDMETRQDLTATRLLEINPDMLVGGAAKANAASDQDEMPLAEAPGAGVREASAPAAMQRLSLEALPTAGAITWGNPRGRTVTVFSDFRCSYCKALTHTLRSLNVRVIERPISVLGSRDLANQVYCAKNREEALHKAYNGEALDNPGTCDTSGLDANEKFAREHGLSGTPVIIRSDGAVIEGYRPKDVLATWIAGGPA